jgi:hypothetical protein
LSDGLQIDHETSNVWRGLFSWRTPREQRDSGECPEQSLVDYTLGFIRKVTFVVPGFIEGQGSNGTPWQDEVKPFGSDRNPMHVEDSWVVDGVENPQF